MLSDKILRHLREVGELPDLSATRYQLIREIGRGGMGVVYLAHDTSLNRNVALKILDQASEACMLASLEHPGIVPVYETGILPDGRVYYAMKFVRGTRLDDYHASTPSLAEPLHTFLRICEPVAFAHSRGVIHGDLKPENIMIGAWGDVLILDWGIARRANVPAAFAGGTDGYMAPEQLAGVTGPQTDIYSLGKVLEHLLSPPDPKSIRAIAAKAAHPDPSMRYAGVMELTAEIVRFLDGQPVYAYQESWFERVSRWISRNKTLTVLVMTYVVARTLIFFFTHR
ncbi:MAG: serine/threonine protein kinase [Acidobacteriaceae bacterium]|nr:serine/threonine protein kinase [Acidobacteriaceae bacterium]